MQDKGRLLKEVLALGVCFRARLSEPDLEVYALLIDKALDDRQWAYAFHHFTAAWKDDAPTFMPSPQELIDVGRLAPPPGRPYIRGTDLPVGEAVAHPELVAEAVKPALALAAGPSLNATSPGRPLTSPGGFRHVLAPPSDSVVPEPHPTNGVDKDV